MQQESSHYMTPLSYEVSIHFRKKYCQNSYLVTVKHII